MVCEMCWPGCWVAVQLLFCRVLLPEFLQNSTLHSYVVAIPPCFSIESATKLRKFSGKIRTALKEIDLQRRRSDNDYPSILKQYIYIYIYMQQRQRCLMTASFLPKVWWLKTVSAVDIVSRCSQIYKYSVTDIEYLFFINLANYIISVCVCVCVCV